MSQDQEDSSLVGGRQRRSAAAKNKAWTSLMSSNKHKGDDDEEEDIPVTPRSAPRLTSRKKPKLEDHKTEESKSPEPAPKTGPIKKDSSTIIPAQAPRLFPSVPQSVKVNSTANGVKSTAALGKEQIDNIEKEMFKTYMSNESDGFSGSEEGDEAMERMMEDDDEDFVAKPKRTYTKRTTTSIRGRVARGGSSSGGGAVRSMALNTRPAGYAAQYPVQNMMITRGDGIAGNQRTVPRSIPTLKYASSAYPTAGGSENRPYKMVLLRQPGKPMNENLYGNGDSPRMPMTISSMSVHSTKEIEEINKKFGERVLPGDSVQKFNDLINMLVNEIKCMTEDRERMVRNHQELTEQMTLSHSAMIDIKESRIRQLENCVSKLQAQLSQMTTKLQAAFSQHESTDKTPSNEEEGGESDEPEKQ